jgi:cytochrome c-type biogenesis protein CcmH
VSSYLSPPVFWFIAILFVAIAVFLVLKPLLRKPGTRAREDRKAINIAIYRDQMRELENDHRNGLLDDGQFESSKREVEARLALDALTAGDDGKVVTMDTRRLGVSLGALIPAVAFGLYFLIGNPGALVSPAMALGQASEDAVQSMDDLLKKTEEKARDNSGDVETQMLLGKTYSLLGRWDDAERTYAVAYGLAPDNATVLAYYAEAIAKTEDRQLTGRPAELLDKALEINPQETKALELAGVRAYQNQEFALAAYYWKRLVGLLPPDDPYTQDMAAYMKQAKGMAMQESFGEPMADSSITESVGGVGKTLAGSVEIAPDLQARLKGTETVYFFARATEDHEEPLIKMSTQAGKLPLEFDLGDVRTGDILSDHESVTLVARISMSGQFDAKAGDFEGQLEEVKVGSRDVRLLIDKVRQ